MSTDVELLLGTAKLLSTDADELEKTWLKKMMLHELVDAAVAQGLSFALKDIKWTEYWEPSLDPMHKIQGLRASVVATK